VPKKNVRLDNVQETILETLDLVADSVTETMGPGGRNVMTTNLSGAPIITKDGVTVAGSIELEDEEKDLVCKIIKEAADRTNKEAGDGTTTSIALTRAIFKEGHKYVKAGHNVTRLKMEMNKGRRLILEALDGMAQKIDTTDQDELYSKLLNIANISMNGEEDVAKLVADAMTSAGRWGIVNVAENDKDENVLEKEDGVKLNQGWCSPFFCEERSDKRIILEDCKVLITSHKLASAGQLKLLEDALKPLINDATPLLVISSECSGEFLEHLVANNKKGRLKNCAIRPPYFGNIRKEFFTDLAILTGATVIEADQGHALERVESKHLGTIKKAEITESSTTLIGGGGDSAALSERIKVLEDEVDNIGYKDLNKAEERLAKLVGGVVLIKLAKQAHIEMEERRHRIEDAVHACKAALEEGVVPGGGAALVRAGATLDTDFLGQKILKEACTAPIRKIAENAGFSGDVAADRIVRELKDNETINALTRQKVDAFEEGIIDPLKVTKHAFANAVSIASILLTTNVLISPIPVDPMVNPYGVY
jgi:chaperonin GroEL